MNTDIYEENETTTILLQSSGNHDRMADFDLLERKLEWWSRSTNLQKKPHPIWGHIAEVCGNTMVFYRSTNGDLHLWIDHTDLMIDEKVKINCVKNNKKREFTVYQQGQEILRLEYEFDENFILPKYDPTPFVEEEDFDFCLFVTNVINDKGRQDRLYRDH